MQRTSAALVIADIYEIHIGRVCVSMIAGDDQIAKRRNPELEWERESRAIWGEWCKGGGTVIDVGAYTGVYAIGAALLGCSALAFEPVPLNHRRILENAKLNGAQVNCYRAALSDRIGHTNLMFNPRVPLTSGASIVGIDVRGNHMSVATGTIDSLSAESLSGLKAIKIDVERAEPLVLRGARETLERFKPTLLVEALGDDERAKVLAEVPGYRVADVLDTRNLVLLPT